jgi:dipeptidase E
MKQLFLTSSLANVADDMGKRIDMTAGNKLAFIYTAAEVEEGGRLAPWNDADRQALEKFGYQVTDYTITDKQQVDLTTELAEYDAYYLSGGNTFYLLQQAQQSGFIEVIRDLVIKHNKSYIGTSAGSIIAGPDIYPTFRLDDASLAPKINGYKGFNLVNFCLMPHWGSEIFKDLYLNKRLEHAYTPNQVP